MLQSLQTKYARIRRSLSKTPFLCYRRNKLSLSTPSPLRKPFRRVIEPLQAFVNTEVSSGLVLLAAAAIALAWANSPWDATYTDLFGTDLSVDGGLFHIHADLRDWINEALMALFFYVAGLEIKRELLQGELSGRGKALLPVAAAVGGMVAPALIYVAINAGGDHGRGWGIPMATDIAFALGVLALLGRRIPAQLRIFLLALAIVDDMGAILVIAVFYTGDVQANSLAIAVGLLALLFALQLAGVRVLAIYVLVGVAAWIAVHASGVHATIAGVALGLLTPLKTPSRPALINRVLGRPDRVENAGEEEPPLERLERSLHPYTSFLIVPLFALANAGISLNPNAVSDSIVEPVALGVAIGLIVGKPAGILGFAWLAVRMRLAALPEGVSWRQLTGVGVLGGVGFTVALFINGLAFTDPAAIEDGKLGILAGSLIAGVVGYLILRTIRSEDPAGPTDR